MMSRINKFLLFICLVQFFGLEVALANQKVVYFRGVGGYSPPPAFENGVRVKHKFTVMGDGTSPIDPAHIPNGKADVVVLNGHGDVGERGTERETAYLPEVIQGSEYAVDAILEIQKKLKPMHYEIYGCNQGALIHDLRRNASQFPDGTSFLIRSSSKYGTGVFTTSQKIRERLDLLSQADAFDPIESFADNAVRDAETVYLAVFKGGKVLSVKSVAPKNEHQVGDVKSYWNSKAKSSERKKSPKVGGLLATLDSEEGNPAYQDFLEKIQMRISEKASSASTMFYKDQTLVLAADRGKLGLVKKLTETKPLNIYLYEALMMALVGDHLEVVKHLWPLRDIRGPFGMDVMKALKSSTASESSSFRVMGFFLNQASSTEKEQLLQKLAEENNLKGITFVLENSSDDLSAASWNAPLRRAVEKKEMKQVQALAPKAEPAAVVKLVQEENRKTVKERDIALVNTLSLVKDAVNQAFDGSGFTVLHRAVLDDDLKLAKKAIELGADVDVETQFSPHSTPLQYAHSPEMVRFLVEQGARANRPNEIGMTPFDTVKSLEILNILLAQGLTPGVKARGSACGGDPRTRFQFEKQPARNLIKYSGGNMLHAYAFDGLRTQLEKRIFSNQFQNEVLASDNFGNTPLHIAVDNLDLIAARFLVEKTYYPKILLQSTNLNLQTVLHIATQRGDVKMVKFLKEKLGFHFYSVRIWEDNSGKSPSDYARESGNQKLIELLVPEPTVEDSNNTTFTVQR